MSLNKSVYIIFSLLLFGFGLQSFISFKADATTDHSDQRKTRTNIANFFVPLPTKAPAPASNPTTKKKIELGRLLFYDPILSGNRDVACASCHHPETAYAEYRDLSIGVNGQGLGSKRKFKEPNKIPFVKRNAHTILNTAFNGLILEEDYDPGQASMFWDMRVTGLEDQVIEPILALEEMRGPSYREEDIIEEVLSRLKKIEEYRRLFTTAFPENPEVNKDNLAKAIAAFERHLITPNSRFDQYLRGNKKAISLAEKEGFKLFKEVGCNNCHHGPMFSDY